MNNRLSVTLLIITISLTSCNKKVEYLNFTGFAQGTTYSMTYQSAGRLDPLTLRSKVEKILGDFDMSLSLYKDSSILCRVNRNETVIVDSFFADVFKKSKAISAMTGGAFDVTVGPLVKAWGFGPDEHRNFSDQKRDSLLRLVGMEKIELRDGRIIKALPGISLDFNAIAQGYSVDVICRYFDRQGIKSYLVEIGGEVRVRGDKNGRPWKIGIDKPVDDNMIPGENLEAIVSLKDRALATSGNYRKFYVENGIKYSHTIDPKTGYPAMNQLLSATILSTECATADGVATACMVMGKDKSIEFLKQHPEFDAFLVYSDDAGNFKTWTSEPLKESITEEK